MCIVERTDTSRTGTPVFMGTTVARRSSPTDGRWVLPPPSALPVERPSLLVSNRKNADLVVVQAIQHAVGKPPYKPPSNTTLNLRPRIRRCSQRSDRPLDFDDKRLSQARPSLRVVVSGFVQLTLRELMKDDRQHYRRRARASRKTSAAARPRDGSESSSASRRAASSVQR